MLFFCAEQQVNEVMPTLYKSHGKNFYIAKNTYTNNGQKLILASQYMLCCEEISSKLGKFSLQQHRPF